MRKPFIAGNWKMNTDSHSSVELAKACASRLGAIAADKATVAVCPPFVYLAAVTKAVSSSSVAVGSQDVYFENNGAFTGEISCAMLKDVGCTYCLVGHSERRHVIGEKDELINKKVAAAIHAGLLPILCVGELLAEREANKTTAVVTEQITKGLAGLSADKFEAVTIAYEPVWAIGTGKTASKEQAQEVHAVIRQLIEKMYGKALAQQVRIQYGGSVKGSNAGELMAMPDIDGLLVGGASLKADDFVQIVEASV
jgi:triosephosphate isomerase (TIM)